MTEPDASLVARVRLEDAAAFEALMRRYFRSAYLVALAQVGNGADAEDVCQDAFVRCWERIQDCREPERFGAWLSRVVRNTAHNRRDYLRVRATAPVEDAAAVPSASRADRAAERSELREHLGRALAQLSTAQREVVLLHDLEGWRHVEVAERLGVSEMMSRRHLADARKKLRHITSAPVPRPFSLAALRARNRSWSRWPSGFARSPTRWMASCAAFSTRCSACGSIRCAESGRS